MKFLILKASPPPSPVGAPEPTDAPPPEAVDMSQNPASDDAEKWDIPAQEPTPEPTQIMHDPMHDPMPDDLHLGVNEQADEARRYGDLGKSMRLVDPERLHETHLVGPDLSDPRVWRHTLLVDDEPYLEREFSAAEDAFLSALRTGALPVPASSEYPLDGPMAFED